MSHGPLRDGFHVDPGEIPASASTWKPTSFSKSGGASSDKLNHMANIMPGNDSQSRFHLDPGSCENSSVPISAMVANLVDVHQHLDDNPTLGRKVKNHAPIAGGEPSKTKNVWDGNQAVVGAVGGEIDWMEEEDRASTAGGEPSRTKKSWDGNQAVVGAGGGETDLSFVGDMVDGVISDSDSDPLITGNEWQTATRKRKDRSFSPNESLNDQRCQKQRKESGINVTGLNPPQTGSHQVQVRPSGPKRYPEVSQYTSSRMLTDLGRVVIISPTGSDEEKNRFVDKSILLYSTIEKSIIGSVGFESIKVNFKLKHAIVVLKAAQDLQTILSLKKLGAYDVSCSVPNSHKMTFGLIRPVGLDTTDEEIIEALGFRENQKHVVPQRIYKVLNKERIATRNIKLIFPDNNRPEYIFLGSQRFRVEPYVQNVLQCYRCQGYGHTSKVCRSTKVKCTICSGNHNYKDCPKTQVLCANCGGGHSAGYGGCPRRKEVREIHKVVAFQNVTYREALLRFRQQEVSPPQSHPNIDKETVIPNPTTQKVKKMQYENVQQSENNRNTMGTQTDQNRSQSCQCNCPKIEMTAVKETSPALMKPDPKFVLFLTELMTTILSQSGKKDMMTPNYKNKIDILVRKHYDITISPNDEKDPEEEAESQSEDIARIKPKTPSNTPKVITTKKEAVKPKNNGTQQAKNSTNKNGKKIR